MALARAAATADEERGAATGLVEIGVRYCRARQQRRGYAVET